MYTIKKFSIANHRYQTSQANIIRTCTITKKSYDKEEQKLKYTFTKMQINIYHHNNVTAFLNNFKGE